MKTKRVSAFYTVFVFSLVFLQLCMTPAAHAEQSSDTLSNKMIIQKGFTAWSNGTGSFFDLLDDSARWTISGNSRFSKTYNRKGLMDEVLIPLNKRLSARIVPSIRDIYADGDTVIVLWDGKATAKDGKPYDNAYAWFMRMKNGRILDVTAFFDTADLDDLWKRVPLEE